MYSGPVGMDFCFTNENREEFLRWKKKAKKSQGNEKVYTYIVFFLGGGIVFVGLPAKIYLPVLVLLRTFKFSFNLFIITKT